MLYKRKQLPKYCLHKSSGRAFVRLGGKMYYLGKHGSEASRREYDRIIGEFIANGRQAFQDPEAILVENLVVSFLDYVERERDYSRSAAFKIKSVMPNARTTRKFRRNTAYTCGSLCQSTG